MRKPAVLFFFRDFAPLYRKSLKDMVDVASQCGYETVVLLEDGTMPPERARVDRVYSCTSFANIDDVRSRVSEIVKCFPISHIFALFEGDVYTAALCREDHDIPGLTPDSAIHFRNKTVMHARARELGLNTPHCCLPLTWKTLTDFVEAVGLPVVVKPHSGFGCLNTTAVYFFEELQSLWGQIKNEREHYRVEQFINGEQYHVETIIRKGVVVFEILGRYLAPILSYRDVPGGSVTRRSQLTAHEKNILSSNRRAVSGFGLETGVTHGEYFLTGTGEVYLGEIGSRPAGGSILPNVEAATGVNIPLEWARVELDARYTEPKLFDGEAGTRFLTGKKHGRICSVTPTIRLLEAEGVVEAEIWKSIGDRIGEPSRSSDFLGYLVAKGTSSEQAAYHVERACGLFSVVCE
jgi:biotin carboxylase